MEDEDVEFQIEMLITELRFNAVLNNNSLVLSITFSLFVSFGLVFLGLGLSTSNINFSILGLIYILMLYPLMYLINKYFNSNKIKGAIDNEIENEFKALYKKYLPSTLKTDENNDCDEKEDMEEVNDDCDEEDKINKDYNIDPKLLFTIINIIILIFTGYIAYNNYSTTKDWIEYQTQLTNFEPYIRVEETVIYLDTENVAQDMSGSILFTGTPSFVISVITPMESVLEIKLLNFTGDSARLDLGVGRYNEIFILNDYIVELPSGLSKFEVFRNYQAHLYPYESQRPEIGKGKGYLVGDMFFEATLRVVPTDKTVTYTFKLPLFVTIFA